jgi:hypothetical protein
MSRLLCNPPFAEGWRKLRVSNASQPLSKGRLVPSSSFSVFRISNMTNHLSNNRAPAPCFSTSTSVQKPCSVNFGVVDQEHRTHTFFRCVGSASAISIYSPHRGAQVSHWHQGHIKWYAVLESGACTCQTGQIEAIYFGTKLTISISCTNFLASILGKPHQDPFEDHHGRCD